MTDLLHLSDPHFGTERDEVGDALLRLHREIAPAMVVVSGDVTQRATATQFERAANFLSSLGDARVMVLPGNHDIPLFDLFTRLTVPYARFSRHFGPDLEPVLETPELLVIAVNTVRAYRHKDGELSRGQIARVASRLRGAGPHQLRVVVAHHPMAVTRPEDETNRAHRSTRAIRAWVPAGADLMLGGHIHLPFLLPLEPADAAQGRRAWQVQAGTAMSSRIRGTAPNSVNLIRRLAPSDDPLHPRSCTLQRWDYDETLRRFALANESTLRFDAGVPVRPSPTVPASRGSPATVSALSAPASPWRTRHALF
ncbi:MAG: metallophosphoesterase [Lautropia sp.]